MDSIHEIIWKLGGFEEFNYKILDYLRQISAILGDNRANSGILIKIHSRLYNIFRPIYDRYESTSISEEDIRLMLSYVKYEPLETRLKDGCITAKIRALPSPIKYLLFSNDTTPIKGDIYSLIFPEMDDMTANHNFEDIYDWYMDFIIDLNRDRDRNLQVNFRSGNELNTKGRVIEEYLPCSIYYMISSPYYYRFTVDELEDIILKGVNPWTRIPINVEKLSSVLKFSRDIGLPLTDAMGVLTHLLRGSTRETL